MSKQPSIQNYYRMNYLGRMYEGTINELSEIIGKPIKYVWSMLDGNYKDIDGVCIGKAHPIYEFYKIRTDEHVGSYTAHDMAEVLGIKLRSLNSGGTYYKIPTGKYKIVEDEDMITRRTINKVAPVPVPEKYDSVAMKKKVTVRPAAEKTFKVGEYAQYLHDSMFKGWNLKEGQ